MDENSPPIVKAQVRHTHSFSAVWIIPIVAAFIALYMGWHSYSQSGPVITIAFNSAEGVVAGQTQIKYRAVAMGTVSDIRLDPKFQKVLVKVKMTAAAQDLITDKTQFWIVRPRLTPGNLSGIETLVSGSYIQCDPGLTKGAPQTSFVGLEEAPATRSDEKGQTFKLQADRLGSIGRGSPIYYRDIAVGEVLNYDIGNGFGPLTLTIFVREPYNKMINNSSRFWNTSSLLVNLGPTGLQLQLQSLQALFSGGIAFYTPKRESDAPDNNQVFLLYPNKQEADLADFKKPIAFISYFDSSFKNIGPGSPVYIRGIQVGEVKTVKLVMDYDNTSIKVQVHFTLQSERAFLQSKVDSIDPLLVTQHLVEKGLRVKVDSGGILPGQNGLSLEFVPNAAPAEAYRDGDYIFMPSQPGGGGFDAIVDALSDIAAKLNHIPLEQISANLNNLLTTANGAVKGLDSNSDFQRDARRTLDQVNDAARSIRLLAEYLNHHPEALIRGRDNKDRSQ